MISSVVPSPRVFISYSHDDAAHEMRVLQLSERLRQDGIDTALDRYVKGTPPEGWPRWMRNQLDDADFVLIVCTETYYGRFCGRDEGPVGRGVDWEGVLISQELYVEKSRTKRFVPVLFRPADSSFIPEPLRIHTWYTLTHVQPYVDLRTFIQGRAGVAPGPIGHPVVADRPNVEPLDLPDEPAPAEKPEQPRPSPLPTRDRDLYFNDVRVGGFRNVLLDHRQYREHLRAACLDARQVVLLPAPLSRASQHCSELVKHVADVCEARVGTYEWTAGQGHQPYDIVDEIAFYLDPQAQIPRPGETTEPAYLTRLAKYLIYAAVQAASRGNKKVVVLVFQNMRAPDTPAPCLTFLSTLVRLALGGTFDARVRLVLLGCKLDQLPDAVSPTRMEPVDPAVLRCELDEVLRSENFTPDAATSFIQGVWTDPLDLERVYDGVNQIIGRPS